MRCIIYYIGMLYIRLRNSMNKLKVYSECVLVFRVSKAKWDHQDPLESLGLRYGPEVFV